ncbi:hypothetical protein PSM36_1972 [Proteiniphilum saccharofermentans]|uniref:Uncharacterized protein n=1 Tax=Proteiniphilum saccharofermentans TaxID=1642647 RepID=A0A1R3SZ58_9BACT|nr:hypothetical protein PSM36_1972 [Proteiniphilum saccharofermentans]
MLLMRKKYKQLTSEQRYAYFQLIKTITFVRLNFIFQQFEKMGFSEQTHAL